MARLVHPVVRSSAAGQGHAGQSQLLGILLGAWERELGVQTLPPATPATGGSRLHSACPEKGELLCAAFQSARNGKIDTSELNGTALHELERRAPRNVDLVPDAGWQLACLLVHAHAFAASAGRLLLVELHASRKLGMVMHFTPPLPLPMHPRRSRAGGGSTRRSGTGTLRALCRRARPGRRRSDECSHTG